MITEAYGLLKNMQFDGNPGAIKDYIKKQLSNQLINQLTFYFYDAKERMREAAKHQLVIESAALNCSKLTTRKLPNTTMKKKKKLRKCAELSENMLFFPLNDGHKSLFTIYTTQRQKKKHKIHRKKIIKKYTITS